LKVYGAPVTTANDIVETPPPTERRAQPRWWLSVLLIVGACLFAAGVAAERHAVAHHTETAAESVPAAGDGDGSETPATSEAPAVSPTKSERASEHVLGIDLESNTLVAAAIALSLALAVLALLQARRSVAVIAAVVAFAFAVFDLAEIAHQVRESRQGLALLAALVAVVHLATSVSGTQRARQT
jgi:hypothetical protein